MKAWEGIREGTGHDIYGTDIDPVFQTFLIGVNDYRVDLKPGVYEVSLYFTEPFSKNARMDPAEKTGADVEGKRVFDILINGTKYYEDLDLAGQYGEFNAVIKRNTVKVGNKGLDLKFIGKKGVPVLSGIKIEALNH
jgi:beta-galactosidase